MSGAVWGRTWGAACALTLCLGLVACNPSLINEGRLPTLAATAPRPALTPALSRNPFATQAATQAPTPTPLALAPSPTVVPTSLPVPSPSATVPPLPSPTTIPAATAAPPTPSPSPPETPRPYLEDVRLVSYYGSAEGHPLGILNLRAREEMLANLRQLAGHYEALSPRRAVLPAFHMVVTVADPTFGEDRNFNHRAELAAVEEWVALAEAEGMALVLDVQPGHAPLQEEFDRLRPYLEHPSVHLALDSEYVMERTPEGFYEVPGEVLGSLYAAQINPIQAQLEEIAQRIGVNKVLIIHQFEDEMVPDKENIVDAPHVELVIDSDGFGGPDKVRDYHQYAQEPGFEYGGFKLYRNWDRPLLTPPEVMALEPPPVVIIYQ